MTRIDAHQHFWRFDAAAYGWIEPSMTELRRDWLPQDVFGAMTDCGVSAAIAVQARHDLQETRWLLELAKSHRWIRGVVGWIDLCSADPERSLDELPMGRLCGIRHIAQDEPDDYLARPQFRRGLEVLVRRQLVYDILIYPRQLPAALDLVRSYSHQSFVLDHLAKPGIATGEFQPWAAQIAELARHEHVACKLSGLVTLVPQGWQAEQFKPYLDHCYAAFGPKRVLFGSDWPVARLAAEDYGTVHRVLADWASKLSPYEQAQLFGGNAERIYGLKQP